MIHKYTRDADLMRHTATSTNQGAVAGLKQLSAQGLLGDPK